MWYLITKLGWYLVTALVIGIIVGWATSRNDPMKNSGSNKQSEG